MVHQYRKKDCWLLLLLFTHLLRKRHPEQHLTSQKLIKRLCSAGLDKEGFLPSQCNYSVVGCLISAMGLDASLKALSTPQIKFSVGTPGIKTILFIFFPSCSISSIHNIILKLRILLYIDGLPKKVHEIKTFRKINMFLKLNKPGGTGG